jgi:hypothetical protein
MDRLARQRSDEEAAADDDAEGHWRLRARYSREKAGFESEADHRCEGDFENMLSRLGSDFNSVSFYRRFHTD